MSLFTPQEGSPLLDPAPAPGASGPSALDRDASKAAEPTSLSASDAQLEAAPEIAVEAAVEEAPEAIAPLPGVYQMRTLQHLSRTLAEEEARFRQSAAWLERLQNACHHVATEAMGLFRVLEEERATALRLAEEIHSLSSQTLGAWPEQGVPERVALPVDELDVSESSFQKDPDMELTARQQHTESFHEMWDSSTAPEMPTPRRSRRRAKRGF
jgi:hypothetical protein